MILPVASNARLAVLLASLAAGGAVMHTAAASPLTVTLITVALFVASLAASNLFIQRHPVKILATCALLAALPVMFYLYADSKVARPLQTDLINYQRTRVVFTATVARADLLAKPRELTLYAVQLESPKRTALSGKTQLNLHGCPDEVFQKLLTDAVNTSRNKEPAIGTTTSLITASDTIVSGTTTQNSAPDLLIRVQGKIAEPKSAAKPWEFDKKKFLSKSGIFSVCYLSKYAKNGLSVVPECSNENLVSTASPNTLACTSSPHLKNIADLATWYESQMVLGRKIIVETHRRFLPHKLADLLSSMVLGNRAIQLPKEITNEFRDVGLSHILAASGFNLTIVIAMTFAICRLLIPSAVLTNLFCFLMMLTFVSLAGVSPSVLRAALMCTIMLLARCGQRKMEISSTLACAFLFTVVCDPLCTDDLGLQLSYAATVGLVLGASGLASALYAGERKWKKLLAEAVAVVLVAQASVMPIQLYFFWKTGTLFMPANLLITPLVTPLTMVGFATSAAALIGAAAESTRSIINPLIAFADAIAFIPLALMMIVVKAFCSIEGANVAVGQPSQLSVVFYYGCLIAWFVSLRIKMQRIWMTALFAVSSLSLLWHLEQPKLCIASIHNHLVLVEDSHTALEIGSKVSTDKMVEKFVTYYGAKLQRVALQPNVWNGHIQYVHLQNCVLILNMREQRFYGQPQNPDGADILALASNKNAEYIVLLVSKADAMTDILSDSQYEKCDVSARLTTYGFRGMEAVMYSRRKPK